ncbi:hypothetical protein T484DRAFT_1886983, partial [Baffinella frigidus]
MGGIVRGESTESFRFDAGIGPFRPASSSNAVRIAFPAYGTRHSGLQEPDGARNVDMVRVRMDAGTIARPRIEHRIFRASSSSADAPSSPAFASASSRHEDFSRYEASSRSPYDTSSENATSGQLGRRGRPATPLDTSDLETAADRVTSTAERAVTRLEAVASRLAPITRQHRQHGEQQAREALVRRLKEELVTQLQKNRELHALLEARAAENTQLQEENSRFHGQDPNEDTRFHGQDPAQNTRSRRQDPDEDTRFRGRDPEEDSGSRTRPAKRRVFEEAADEEDEERPGGE